MGGSGRTIPRMAGTDRTWDGLPVARERPYASCVVVWRNGSAGRELLVLHRLAPGGPGFEGDWAWTPPSGARQPGETPEAAAARELREETGLALAPERVASPSADVALFVAEAPADAEVVLDAEHDRCRWVDEAEALRLCLPAAVGAGIRAATAGLVYPEPR